MSIEQRHPVIMKKAQLGSDQCSLSAVLPMSCRGRAEAFARRLHTRLRSLGTPDAGASPSSPPELFLDFDLDYEGPSSPAEEAYHHNDSDCDSLYLDAEEGEAFPVNQSNKAKFNRLYEGALINNNSKKVANKNEEGGSPAGMQNGHAEKRLFSPISLDCLRRNGDIHRDNGVDQVDRGWPQKSTTIKHSVEPMAWKTAAPESHNHINTEQKPAPAIANGIHTPDEEIETKQEITIETKEEMPVKNEDEVALSTDIKEIEQPEIITKEASVEKEASPIPEGNLSLLRIDDKEKQSSEEENDSDDKIQRVRRCSSLKTGKTPPGTPGRKKIVRFADVLGLDLADVKTFMDDIPTVPKSAFLDLLDADVNAPPPAYPLNGLRKPSDKHIVPMFQPPCILPNFMDILNEKYVCLETAMFNEGLTTTICGTVRVRNLDFHKSVHIRYTMNGWKAYTDIQAAYVQGSCDGFSDTFTFTLYPPTINVGQKLEFAVRFQCKGCQYWDNNAGINYCYQCLPFIGHARINPIAPPLTVHPMENWHPSFY